MALAKSKINELEAKATPVLSDNFIVSDSEDDGRGKLVTGTALQTLIGCGGGGGAVDSVAGKTGDVTLDASDISETAALKIMTADERTKLTGIAEGAEVNTVDSVAGKTGDVTLDADDVSPTASKLWMSDTQASKLSGIAENANNYTHPETHPQSMIDGLADALAAKAPLASPALTGTPTAPTAAAGTNTTQLATTAFVQSKNADWEMITGRKHFDDSGTGNEGIEISRFNIKTVRSNYGIIPQSTAGTSGLSIGGPSNKYASLNLENAGVVSATTAPVGTNTTQLATTAFVQAAVAGALSLKGAPGGPTVELLAEGTPSGPTATGMNTTQLATDALTGDLLLTEGTPSGHTAAGTKGMARFDANYFYVCTATNTWARFPKDGAWT